MAFLPVTRASGQKALSASTDLILRLSPHPHVRQLVLNRPAKRNALNNELIAALASACREAALDPDVRCMVISGSDTVFSAGADIKEMQQRGFEAIDNAARRSAWNDITRFSKPLIAAVEGICFGGGHELALLADVIVAGETARFAQPEINIGVLPGDGATQRLTRAGGKALAMLMVLTGEPISATQALQAGLISEVVAAGQATTRALAIAQMISQKPPRSAQLAKAAVLSAFPPTLVSALEF